MSRQTFEEFDQLLSRIKNREAGRGLVAAARPSVVRRSSAEPQPIRTASPQLSASHRIRLKDVGGGDLETINRCIVEMLDSEYAEDLKRLVRVVCYGHSPQTSDGDTPMGFACMMTRAITISTRFDYAECLDTVKHELGHLKHGWSEESAEQYAQEWF